MSIEDDKKIKESIKRIEKSEIKFRFRYDRYEMEKLLDKIKSSSSYHSMYPNLRNNVNDKESRIIAAKIYWHDDLCELSEYFGDEVGLSEGTIYIGYNISVSAIKHSKRILEQGEWYYTPAFININASNITNDGTKLLNNIKEITGIEIDESNNKSVKVYFVTLDNRRCYINGDLI